MLIRLKRTLILSALELAYRIFKKIAKFDLQHVEPHLVNSVDKLNIYSREDYIIARCKGKRVLHLGCAAFPFTESRLDEGNLLHQKLLGVCSSLVGVDNSEEAVNFLKKKLATRDIFLLDIHEIEALSNLEKFEVILAGEIIEHLENPGLMLTGAAKLLKNAGILLATVPNAFKYRNFFAAQQGFEIVHKEHTSWHSYQTIRRLFEMCGYSMINISGYINADHWIGGRFLKHSSLFCDGLIVEATHTKSF